MNPEDLKLAQGQAKVANAADRQKDAAGITNPNLHRRIDPELYFETEEKILTTADDKIITTTSNLDIAVPTLVATDTEFEYTVTVGGVNSFRTTNSITHNEESEDSEIP